MLYLKYKLFIKIPPYPPFSKGGFFNTHLVFRLLVLIASLYYYPSVRAEDTVINDVPVECIHSAAQKYYVPIPLIVSTLLTENGRIGDANPNKNGTYDYGPMQINTIWLDKLAHYGISREAIQYDPCINMEVGVWILSQALAEGQTFWTGVGNYHSHTISENSKYAGQVKQRYDALMEYLQ